MLISLNFETIHSWVSLLLLWGWSLAEPVLNAGETPHRTCWAIWVWGDLSSLFSLTPSINCYEAGCFFEKMLISMWIPVVSPCPLSSSVFSVPEVFTRIWRFCFFYAWGVECLQGDKSKRREKNTQPPKPNNVERKKWHCLWLSVRLTFQ